MTHVSEFAQNELMIQTSRQQQLYLSLSLSLKYFFLGLIRSSLTRYRFQRLSFFELFVKAHGVLMASDH